MIEGANERPAFESRNLEIDVPTRPVDPVAINLRRVTGRAVGRIMDQKMKVIKTIFAALEVISIVVAAYALSVPSLDYVFPAGLGAICLFLGLEALVTGEVATRINLISKLKNKVFFYLMISTWFIFSALLFQHSLSLWAKH